MDKKGFTLIELLAVIVLIGIVGIIVVPNVIDDLNMSRNKAYEILEKDIKIAAENYYQECEYGDLKSRNSSYCNFDSDSIDVTLEELAMAGFLTAENKTDAEGKVIKDEKGNIIKKIKDPRDNKELNNCSITITKTKAETTDDNGIKHTKVTYEVEIPDDDDNCPTSQGE